MKLADLVASRGWLLLAHLGAAVGLLIGVLAIVDRFTAATPRILAEAYPASYIIAPTDNDWLDSHARQERDYLIPPPTQPNKKLPPPMAGDEMLGRIGVAVPEVPCSEVRYGDRGTATPIPVPKTDVLTYSAMLVNIRLVNYGNKRASDVKIMVKPSFYDAVVGRRLWMGAVRGEPATVNGLGKEFQAIAIGTLDPTEQLEVYVWTQRTYPNYFDGDEIVVTHADGVGDVVRIDRRYPLQWRLWRYVVYKQYVVWLAALGVLVLSCAATFVLKTYRIKVSKRTLVLDDY